ncbi:MAG TPA: multicopper oxidase domain-containing protein [Planctomycetota bacterium]
MSCASRIFSRSFIPAARALGVLGIAAFSFGSVVRAQDDPLAGLPPANEGAFEGGQTGTEHDAGLNNSVQENEQTNGGTFNVPTNSRPSPLFGAQPFTQRMLLFEEFGTEPMPTTFNRGVSFPSPANALRMPDGGALDAFLRQRIFPAPAVLANEVEENPWRARIESFLGRTLITPPADGRPPGNGWAHQRWGEFTPQVHFQSVMTGARRNGGVRDSRQRHGYSRGEFAPGGLYHNTVGAPGFDGTTAGIDIRFHPNMPIQDPQALWTFDGTLPPKLLMARYGDPILFRHYNGLPIDPSANRGFGLHTITTHEHNGHNPAESDGFANAFFFPGQYWDYRWPMQLAGYDSVNVTASDPRAGAPDGNGGIRRLRGDWRETMSTHWFHDHMLDFTAQNVFKGNAAMMNYYSSIDRGNEAINDGINLRFPSGTALDWGNRDYDVNLVVADKAFDAEGQLWYNIFNFDGFLGDVPTVNFLYKPYMEVRARRYRFRILNGCVARYLKLALVNQNGQPVPFHLIANDGNIMEHAVAFDGTRGTMRGILPEQGIAERYDIVVDFRSFRPGDRLYLVNLLEHQDGRGPERMVPLSDVWNNRYRPQLRDDNGDGVADRWINGDPVVGRLMEFRVREYTGTDRSMNPADYVAGRRQMIPLARPSANELANAPRREFEFGRSSGTDEKPWTVKTDGGSGFGADPRRISAAPNLGQLSADGLGHLEVWTIRNGGGGWSHPVHIHFEEGIFLSRDGATPPEWERWARKDMYRIGDLPDSSREIEVAIRIREFAGTYVEHCHNTTHEDHAMLLRWDSERPGQLEFLPTPIPTWDGVGFVPSVALPTARRIPGDDPPPPPPTGEVLTVTSARYSPTRGWRIEGTLTGSTQATPRVRAHVGATIAGPVIGTASVGADSSWLLRVTSTSPAPDATNTVSFDTNGGTVLQAIPVERVTP